MSKNNSVAFAAIAGVGTLCIALVTTRQCFTNTSGDQYLSTLLQASMTNDPTGKNTVSAKLPQWSIENWTVDDKEYSKSRQEVDSSKTLPKIFEVAYQFDAKNQPHSALSQFRWAYPLWKRIAPEQPSSQRTSIKSAIFHALARADSPNTYSYARLRFLVSPDSKKMTSIGERLLTKKPDDSEVKINLVEDYAFSVGEDGNQHSKMRALELSQQLVQANPSYAKNYSVLCNLYEASYLRKHNASDAAAGIAAGQKYISLVDPNGEYAKMIQGSIAEIKADVAKD